MYMKEENARVAENLCEVLPFRVACVILTSVCAVRLMLYFQTSF